MLRSRLIFRCRCSLLCFLPLAAGLLSATAGASVVYHTANATTPVSAAYDEGGVWFDFFTGTVTTKTSGSGYLESKPGQYQLMLNSAAGWLNFTQRTTATTTAAWSNNTGNGVERIGAGQSVDPADIYTNLYVIMASMDSYANEWDGLGRDFIGVTFTNEAAERFYGYVDVTVNADYTATLNGFAYETTPNTAIVTGAIPEPSTLGVLAFSVLLITGRHRSRRRK
jgi:hypothetical protein